MNKLIEFFRNLFSAGNIIKLKNIINEANAAPAIVVEPKPAEPVVVAPVAKAPAKPQPKAAAKPQAKPAQTNKRKSAK